MLDKSFEVILADTEHARQINYQLRYQVYCLEEGFEPASNFPDGAERDEWDEHAAHFIVRDKQSHEWIAAMRLVLPQKNGLPVENQCSIDSRVAPSVLDGDVAEISRMCIKDSFRRNKRPQSNIHSPNIATISGVNAVNKETQPAPAKPPKRSEIMSALLVAAEAYSRENGIRNWYFLTTPALARIISYQKIQLIKVGDAFHHHGVRYPFLINIKEAARQAILGCSTIGAMLASSNVYRRFSELNIYHEDMPVERSLVA